MHWLRQHAFSLIELVIFIVIIGIIAAGFSTYAGNANHTYFTAYQTKAMQLARARMEMIMASYRENGYTNMTDPCDTGSPPAACTLPTGYSIATPTISTTTLNSTTFKLITITLTGNAKASLSTVVGDV